VNGVDDRADVESLPGPRSLGGRVALVTGSSSGIGAAIAGTFAERGATVVVNSAPWAEAGEQPAAERPGASYPVADVADPRQAARLVATTVERYGRLDIVVNDAGIAEVAGHADPDAATSDAWEPVLRVSVVGTWNVVRAAAPHLRATGDGVILNVSPITGGQQAGSSIPYAVCAAALDELTALFASALAPQIHVRSVAPVMDPDTGRLVGAVAASCPADQSDAVMTPLGRGAAHAKRLWPRSLTGRALGTPDARAVEVTLRRELMLSHQQLTERGLTEAVAAAVGAEDVEPPPPSSPSSGMTE
jgi:ketoreductase RED2